MSGSLNNASLYTITAELAVVLAMIDDSADGEIPPEFEQRLDALTLAFPAKCEDLCKHRAMLIATAAGIKLERDRLSAKLERLDAQIARVSAYLKRSMEATGQLKLETPSGLFALRVQKNTRPTIRLADGAPVPDAFRRLREELDGDAAYKAWKAGQELPESLIVIQGSHLRVS